MDVLDHLDLGVVVMAPDPGGGFRCVHSNAHARATYGFHAAPQPIDDIVPADQLSAWVRLLERTETERGFRAQMTAPNGRLAQVHASRRPEGDVVISLTAPTHRIDHDELFQAYEAALARHGVGLWWANFTTGELWWSDTAFELLGIEPGPISTTAFLQGLSDEAQRIISEQFEQEIANQGSYAPRFAVELPGELRYVEDRSQAMSPESTHGAIVHVGATIDRTHETRLEADLAALRARLESSDARRDAGRLVGAIAHDLNNIMTMILGNVELLSLELEPDDPRVVEHLNSLSLATGHVGALASRMLEFMGDMPLQLGPIEVGAFVAERLSFLQTLVPRSIPIAFEAPGADAVIRADDRRLEQALFSLVRNAGQALQRGGQITISVVVGTEIEIVVADDGVGIPSQQLDQIFIPMFSTRPAGAGIGLSGAKAIVEAHGGTISVDSQPGEGSRFAIRLPQSIDPIAPSARAEPGTRRSELRVWLLDNLSMVRSVIERVLKSVVGDVVSFHDPQSLVEALEHTGEQPDLILADLVTISMWDLDGGVPLSERWPQIPIVYTSGYSGSAPARSPSGATPHAVLRKPFSTEQLVAAIDAALSDEPPSHPAP